MSHQNKTGRDWLIFIGTLLLVILLTGLILLFLKSANQRQPNLNNLKKFSGRMNYRHLPIPNLSIKNNQTKLGLKDINTIQTWMTFDYLNKAFSLPADYLKTSLNIDSSSYPLLTINHLARLKEGSASSTLDLVQKNISTYLERQ